MPGTGGGSGRRPCGAGGGSPRGWPTPETWRAAASLRAFLRGATAATALSYSRVYGANDRIQLGLIGCGERGRYDMGNFVKTGKVDVVALCDIWASQIDKAKQNAAAANAKTFDDHRKLLDMKEVDVALIGVPDHWHARHRHRRAERGQGRLRRKAADAARSKKGRRW